MHVYPNLLPIRQAALPKLIEAPIVIPNKFEDSTHKLWKCVTADGPMVLKVCDHKAIANSRYWLGMNHLFDADFPNSLDKISKTHALLAEYGAFPTPEFIAASANEFVLTRFLPGVDIVQNDVSDQMVVQLANHISQLHKCTNQRWGKVDAPAFSTTEWSLRLQQSLTKLARNSHLAIPDTLLAEIIEQAGKIKESKFVPIMLDLRWDQFRVVADNNLNSPLALIDLDAFAVAPKNLELVLLEYVLSAEQFALFKSLYIDHHSWPDYAQEKPCYQLLLFLMNVLGETDVHRWMRQS